MVDFNFKKTEREFLHGGNVYAIKRAAGTALPDILDFSANINPLGLSQKVRNAMLECIDTVIHYPDPEGWCLKEAISSHYGVEREFITLGNGAAELIYVLSNIIKPKHVLLPAPTFSEYRRAAQAVGAEIRNFYLTEQNGFTLKTNSLAKELRSGEMTYICNPNNPTGTLLDPFEIEKLLCFAAGKNSLVVVDESFIDFLEDCDNYTCRPLLKKYPNLVIIHSLTKFYAIAGLRLGFSLSSPALATAMHQAKDVWNVNTLAQCAGVAALADYEYQVQSRKILKSAQTQFYQNLRTLPGFHPYNPTVNYIFVNVRQSGFTAAELSAKLAEKNILIRDCANYPGLSAEYIRVAVKLAEQNNILIASLRSIIDKKGTLDL